MSTATKKSTRSPRTSGHLRGDADSHELIRVQGARVLKDVSIEIPKRRLTVFTGVSGSGKSSLVFGTIAHESQRLIGQTYQRCLLQGFMPSLARPEVDVLDGLTTAILVDEGRMGTDPRSTVGTATDANAVLHRQPAREAARRPAQRLCLQRRLGHRERWDHGPARRQDPDQEGDLQPHRRHVRGCEGRGSLSDFDLSALYDDSKSINEGAIHVPGYSMDGWYGRIFRGCGFFDPDKPIRSSTSGSATTCSTRNRPRSRSRASTSRTRA